jgi:hypothetical protein
LVHGLKELAIDRRLVPHHSESGSLEVCFWTASTNSQIQHSRVRLDGNSAI